MKKKFIGIALAVVVVISLVALFALNSAGKKAVVSAATVQSVSGVIGSEKQAFFADPRVQKVLRENGLKVNIETAGSRQIATSVDLTKYDFAFPASAPAAQKIQDKMKVSDVYSPFYSPMVIATYKPVVQLLAANGVASQGADGVWRIDMKAYLALASSGKRWSDLVGAKDLYNSPRSILISSTDIRKSNSAAMYLSIASYVLNNSSVVSTSDQEATVLPPASKLFLSQGYSGASSDEPFQDYLSQGAGAVPMVMIYEAQFVGEASQSSSRVTDQMVMAYPDPTVFSKHVLIPFSTGGKKLGQLLTTNPDLIKLEAQFGFRTPDSAAFLQIAKDHKVVVQPSVTSIAETPSYEVLEAMIDTISKQYTF